MQQKRRLYQPNELRVAYRPARASLLMRDILAMAAEDILADATWHKLLKSQESKAKHHTQARTGRACSSRKPSSISSKRDLWGSKGRRRLRVFEASAPGRK
jgi:hypothetical protein